MTDGEISAEKQELQKRTIEILDMKSIIFEIKNLLDVLNYMRQIFCDDRNVLYFDEDSGYMVICISEN